MFDQIQFNAVTAPIYDKNGKQVPSHLGRGVYRDDTGEMIAMAGRGFKPVQHMDVINPMMDVLNEQGYEIEERASASPSNFYDLKGQKSAWVSTKVDHDGAVMRSDIILGDFVEPTGSSSYLPKGEDTMFYRISLLNSHNGSLAVHANVSHLRLICLNGMVGSNWSLNTRAKHTSGLNIDALKAKIANAASATRDEDAEKFGLYARTKVTLKEAELFFQRTVAKLANKPNGDTHWSDPLVNQLLENFAREDQTAWGLWNAMTQWSSHGKRKVNASALTTTLGRESKVAQAMRSPEWNEIISF